MDELCLQKIARQKMDGIGQNPGRSASPRPAGLTPQHIGVRLHYWSNVTRIKCR